jgi:S-adenosylmethionine:tRNA ribosyltransferase-isomerase
MRTDSFDFHLPRSRIALKPLEQRDSSRLLVLKKDGTVEHRQFTSIVDYLLEGDLLILNNSKVIPARLTGRKPDGNRLEILLVRKSQGRSYHILSKGKYTGKLYFENGLEAEIVKGKIAEFNTEEMDDLIWSYGRMPLPPYIGREPDERDRRWYQTVYAEKDGSIAAPTAGLHFTDHILERIRAKGVTVRKITLHVGTGTFRPVMTEFVRDHLMEPEEFEVERTVIESIRSVKEKGKRVFAVGTTTTRTVEALMSGKYTAAARQKREVEDRRPGGRRLESEKRDQYLSLQ